MKNNVLFIVVFFAFCLSLTSPVSAKNKYQSEILNALQPHKAIYKLHMVSKRSESQIINVSGQMLYDWEDDCDGWSSKHQLDVSYEYAESPAVRVTNDYTTYETRDSQEFNFSTLKHNNGIAAEHIRGYATRNGPPRAKYAVPKGLNLDLPDGTLFPVSHTLKVMEQIKRGKRFFHATVFDGGNKDGAIDINTFIGERVNIFELDRFSPSLEHEMLKSPARKVRLAFFSPNAEEPSVPDYEMSIILHDNGLISDMVVEYEDFSIAQQLIALETRDKSCSEAVKRPQ